MCSSLRYLFLLKIILFEIQEKVIIATAVVVVHKKSPKIFQTRELCWLEELYKFKASLSSKKIMFTDAQWFLPKTKSKV